MAAILIIEDDDSVRQIVSAILKTEGHQVTAAADGASALEMALAQSFDLYILDLVLPDMSGLDVGMRLRQRQTTPILMLTGRDSEGDELTGLALGADDYITKPFSPAILAARVRSALRRSQAAAPAGAPDPGPPPEPVGITLGELVINTEEWTVTLGGEPVALTSREFKLLCTLARSRNRVLTREALIERVWGDDFEGSDRVVDVSLSRLRRHLLDLPNCPISVQAIPGVGYKVRHEVESVSAN